MMPPGRTWMVVLLFLILILTSGVVYNYPPLRQSFVDQYPSWGTSMDIVVEISLSVMFVVAAPGGMAISKWGSRKVALFGSILSVVGFFLLAAAFQWDLYLAIFFGYPLAMGGSALRFPAAINMQFEFPERFRTMVALVGIGLWDFSSALGYLFMFIYFATGASNALLLSCMAGLMALVGLSVVLLSPSMGNPLAAQPQPAPAAQELHHAGEVVEEQGEQGEEEASLPLRDEDEEAALPQRDEDEGAPLLPRRAQVGGYKTYDGDRRQAAPPPALDVELEETQQDVPVVQVNTDYRSLVPRRQFKKMMFFFLCGLCTSMNVCNFVLSNFNLMMSDFFGESSSHANRLVEVFSILFPAMGLFVTFASPVISWILGPNGMTVLGFVGMGIVSMLLPIQSFDLQMTLAVFFILFRIIIFGQVNWVFTIMVPAIEFGNYFGPFFAVAGIFNLLGTLLTYLTHSVFGGHFQIPLLIIGSLLVVALPTFVYALFTMVRMHTKAKNEQKAICDRASEAREALANRNQLSVQSSTDANL